MQKVSPCLWFDGQAEEAMNLYLSLFKNAKMTDVVRWGDTGPGPKGSVLTCAFELDGQEFTALNGGPMYQFTPAISLSVDCDTQAEVDELWEKLGKGGRYDRCGWLQDRFGLSWQIVPSALVRMLQDKNAEKATRARDAMFKMGKIEIAVLERAFEGA